MKLRFQIGSNRPLAKRNARMFCAASLPRKWSMRKIWLSSECFVHESVEFDCAGQVGAERLLHHDPRPGHQFRLPQHGDHRAGGLWWHRKVVQPTDFRSEFGLGGLDGGGQRFRPGFLRHIVDRFGDPGPLLIGQFVRAELLDRLLGQLEELLPVMSSREVATISMLGVSSDWSR